MVISTTYSCAISSSASDVDRLLLEVVAELSGAAVTFSTASAGSSSSSGAAAVTAVGTLTNAFTGQSSQIALIGVESILKKWFGEALDAVQDEVVSSWIYAVEMSVLMPLRHGEEGECCNARAG